MHRVILGLPTGDPRHVDHANGDGLDNRRVNLRLASMTENARNQRVRLHSSQYKGVSAFRRTHRWTAAIHLGYFLTERAAAEAYDDAARRLFGEFARCNFPAVAACFRPLQRHPGEGGAA